MITLKVADYCHDCPGFEAEVDKDYRIDLELTVICLFQTKEAN